VFYSDSDEREGRKLFKRPADDIKDTPNSRRRSSAGKVKCLNVLELLRSRTREYKKYYIMILLLLLCNTFWIFLLVAKGGK